MLANTISALTFVAAIGSGLMAGLFFTYSNSVLPGLAKMPVPQGVAAMNHMNVVIQNPLFLSIFMGTTLIGIALIVVALLGWTARPGWVIAAALLYVIGNFALTMGVNVPVNNALAAVTPDSQQAAQLWATYLDRWVFWNSVRALACVAALAGFIAALM